MMFLKNREFRLRRGDLILFLKIDFVTRSNENNNKFKLKFENSEKKKLKNNENNNNNV